MVVGIDGSTFKYHPHFSTWIHDKVEELIEPGYKVSHLSYVFELCALTASVWYSHSKEVCFFV